VTFTNRRNLHLEGEKQKYRDPKIMEKSLIRILAAPLWPKAEFEFKKILHLRKRYRTMKPVPPLSVSS